MSKLLYQSPEALAAFASHEWGPSEPGFQTVLVSSEHGVQMALVTMRCSRCGSVSGSGGVPVGFGDGPPWCDEVLLGDIMAS